MKKIIISLLLAVATPLLAAGQAYPETARKSPIAFSQVREDPFQDLEILKTRFPEGKVSIIMVASGGCTVAELLAEGDLEALTVVDPNPSQIYLTKVKAHLLHLPQEKRMQLLGHQMMDSGERLQMLAGIMLSLDIPEDGLGDLEEIALVGLDNVGRYEHVFRELRSRLSPFRDEIIALFTLDDLEEQRRRIAVGSPLGNALDKAFEEVFAIEHLVKIFGADATANSVKSFSEHFSERTRTYLETRLAKESPFM